MYPILSAATLTERSSVNKVAWCYLLLHFSIKINWPFQSHNCQLVFVKSKQNLAKHIEHISKQTKQQESIMAIGYISHHAMEYIYKKNLYGTCEEVRMNGDENAKVYV